MRNILFLIFIVFWKPLYGQNSNYSVSYLSRGVSNFYQNWSQEEINFIIENPYNFSNKFTQLYRWRYLFGEFNGLIFEYNNRFYLVKNVWFTNSFHKSSLYIQAKFGHGILRGKSYPPNTIQYFNPIFSQEVLNTELLEDNNHYILNSGIGIGYKFVYSNSLTLDLGIGFLGATQPNFVGPEKYYRLSKWKRTIMSPVEVFWSLGFLVNQSK